MKTYQLFSIFLYLPLLLLLSCGQTSEEEVDDAVDRARSFLSSKDCDKALEILNEVGYQNKHAKYLQVYASGLACKTTFNEPTFFATDLPKLGTVVVTTSLFGALATFSTSTMTSPTSGSFVNLQSAIDTLLYAGGLTDASHANRLEIFTASETNNMDVQLLYMIMAQMGQYLSYYGDADSSGVKGGGTASNTCLLTYPGGNAVAIDAIDDGSSGVCTDVANTGHDSLESGVSTSVRTTRICHFITLFNNFIDIIANVSFTGAETGVLGDLTGTFNALCSGNTQVPNAICGLRTQITCEASSVTNLEIFMAWIVERNML